MNLYRYFTTVSACTALSRVFGFVREMLLAALFGTGWVAESFITAFRLPNLFRRLFAEGAFNTAFVPLFAEKLEQHGNTEARRFASEILVVLVVILAGLTIAAEIFMGGVIYIMAPGFRVLENKFFLTVEFSRIMFPYLFCMSLVAMLSGILNAYHRYFIAAFAPVLLNVVLVATLATCWWAEIGATPQAGRLLSFGVLAAGILQLLLLAHACRKSRIQLTFKKPASSPDVRQLLRLIIPTAIAGGITQINIFIGHIIASTKAASVAFLYFADRIYQLPLGIIGIAVGVVLLPELTRSLRAKDISGAQAAQNQSLCFAMFFALPAAAALIAIPVPVVNVLFERGAWVAADTAQTARVLTAFAFGLPAFVLIKVLSPGYFARLDMRTPVYFALINMIVNVTGSLALFPVWHHVGIAISTSIAAWVHAVLMTYTLFRRGHLQFSRQSLSGVVWMIMAAIVMGVVVFVADTIWLRIQMHEAAVLRIAGLCALIGIGLVSYIVPVYLSGACNIHAIFRRSRNR